jgi:hypothetical protein
MNLRVAVLSLLASTMMCAAPALANGNGLGPGQHIGRVFITPVACDTEADIYQEGAFIEWVRTQSGHFAGLKVGMTNPLDDGNTVGVRLDGGTQGIPFGPARNWTMTYTESNGGDCADVDFAVVFSLPGDGILVLGSDGYDEGLTTVNNGDGSYTTTANYSSFDFPTGTTFVGIYMNNFDDECSFNTTVTFASVDGVAAQPNNYTGRKATNGFVSDCNGDVSDAP